MARGLTQVPSVMISPAVARSAVVGGLQVRQVADIPGLAARARVSGAVLAPDVTRRADRAALPPGGETVIRGAGAVARQTLVLGPRARFAEPALVNGTAGAVVAPPGRLLLVLAFTVADGRVAGYDVIADPARLGQLDLAVLGEDAGPRDGQP